METHQFIMSANQIRANGGNELIFPFLPSLFAADPFFKYWTWCFSEIIIFNWQKLILDCWWHEKPERTQKWSVRLCRNLENSAKENYVTWGSLGTWCEGLRLNSCVLVLDCGEENLLWLFYECLYILESACCLSGILSALQTCDIWTAKDQHRESPAETGHDMICKKEQLRRDILIKKVQNSRSTKQETCSHLGHRLASLIAPENTNIEEPRLHHE